MRICLSVDFDRFSKPGSMLDLDTVTDEELLMLRECYRQQMPGWKTLRSSWGYATPQELRAMLKRISVGNIGLYKVMHSGYKSLTDPLENLPLYINEGSPWHIVFAKWRLKIGR